MQGESNSETSKTNLRGKLRLKRNSIDSSENNSSQTIGEVIDNDFNREKNFDSEKTPPNKNISNSSNTDDSLADFKSPPNKPEYKSILNKFKIDSEKAKKNILKSKNKSNVKTKNVKTDANQPLLESTFFKLPSSKQSEVEVKESFPCPLCLKPFKDDTSQFNHMKICASKSNVSIKQLLDAKKLQERQAEERKAMGLLAAPAIPERKKVFRSKNYTTGDDQQLQLVKALSESLYEAQQLEDLEKVAIIAGIPSECIREMNDEERRVNLQSFGFTTNKPVVEEAVNKTKKKKLSASTVLQSRSKDDKDRVLAERIACILTGDDALTQANVNTGEVLQEKIPIVIKSSYLKDIERKTNRIWDRSKLTKKINNFHVKNLEIYLLTSDRNNETEYPSNLKLENKNNSEQNIFLLNESIAYEPVEFDVPVNETENDLTLDQNEILSQESKSLLEQAINHDQNVTLIDQSFSNDHMEIDVPLKETEEIEKDNNFLDSPEIDNMNSELDFMKKMISNWGEAINDSGSSDIIIFVKNKKHIYAHRLVFFIQCSNILSSIKKNDTKIDPHIKDQICWLDKDELSVLAFLEFVYCGIINTNISVFEDDVQLSELQNLGKLYRVKGLSTYIKLKHNELKRLNTFSTINQIDKKSDNQALAIELLRECNNPPKAKKSLSFEFQPLNTKGADASPAVINCREKNPELKKLKSRQTTLSPDLFDSEPEDGSAKKNKNVENINKENSPKSLESIDKNPGIENSEISDSEQTIINLSPTDLENIDVASKEMQEDVEEMCQIGTQSLILENNEDEDDNDFKLHTEIDHVTKTSVPSTSEFISDRIKEKTVYSSIELDSDQEENIIKKELIYDAVTPPRLKESNEDDVYSAVTPPPVFETSEGNKMLEESRANITCIDKLIEKIRKQNAKNIMDTDSETDSPKPKIKKMNPFRKRNKNDSYTNLTKDSTEKDQHRVISLLERDILEENNLEGKNTKNALKENSMDYLLTDEFSNIHSRMNLSDEFEKSQSKSTKEFDKKRHNFKLPEDVNTQSKIQSNDSRLCNSEDEITGVTMNESDMSMYSKYKKDNKHHNSIEKYRSELNFDGKQSTSKQNISSVTSENSDTSKKSLKVIFKNSGAECKIMDKDVTLVSDSDDEFEKILGTSKSSARDTEKYSTKNSFDNDNKSDESSKNNNSIPSNSLETNSKNIEFDHNFINDRKKMQKSKKVTSPKIVLKNHEDEIINLSSDSDQGNGTNDSLKPNYSPSSLEIKNNFDYDQKDESKLSDSNKNNNSQVLESTEKKHDDVEAEISKILETCPSPVFDNEQDFIKKPTQTVIGNNFRRSEEETAENEVINLSPISIMSSPEPENKNNESNNSNVRFKDSEHDTGWITTPSKKTTGSTTPKRKKLRKSELFSPAKPLPSKNSSVSALISSPILSQNKKVSRTKSNKSASTQSSVVSEKCRKLKTKSASAINVTERSKKSDGRTIQKSVSFTTPDQNKLDTAYLSDLDTPHLHKELRKFGVKPQPSKKAKLLLRHIYNHVPVVASLPKKRDLETNSSSEDEAKPPRKKPAVNQNYSDENEEPHEENSQNCQIIAEEMDYNPETDPPSELGNARSLKDAFYELVETDKDLYTKIVIYEPLSLESLHSRLKQNGVKCKINELMDFLDHQCITFQVQNSKGSRTKKKK